MIKVLLLFFVIFSSSFSPKSIEKYEPINLNDDLELGHKVPKDIYKVGISENNEDYASNSLEMILNSDLVITEIMYNPSNSDNAWEWVEIYNRGLEEIDLSGFVFDDDDGAILTEANISGGILAPGSSAILFNESVRTAEQFRQAWGDVNLIPVSTWSALNNSGDALAIWESIESYNGDRTEQVNAIVRVVYENNSSNWPDDDGSASIYLTDLALDTANGANWALSMDGIATPLFDNYVSVPFGNNLGLDIGSPGLEYVNDSEAPLIVCNADINDSSEESICGTLVQIVNPVAIDNISTEFTFDAVRNDGLLLSDVFPVGQTIVTWTAMDDAGNISESCLQLVTIIDEIVPVVQCGSNIIQNSNNGGSVVMGVEAAIANDNCLEELIATPTRSDGLALSAPFPVGVTSIVWQALDAEGNRGECTQTVTINYTAAMENDITSFTIPSQNGATAINITDKTIMLYAPFGTDLSTIVPTITVSSSATLNPNSGIIQDFTFPVSYIVTAEDNSEAEWIVIVEVENQDTELIAVTKFILINADTNEDLLELTDGLQIDLNSLPTQHLDIKAITTTDVESVAFILSGELINNRTESNLPYALFGDVPTGNYRGADFTFGNYILSAIPYSEDDKKGDEGMEKTISFELVDGNPLCFDYNVEFAEIIHPTRCNGNDGKISMAASGGNEVVTYNWSHDGTIDSPEVLNLPSGNYTVTAINENGCKTSLTIELVYPELPVVELLPFEDVFDTESPFIISGGLPLGGDYSGEGVEGGMFNPSIGAGEFELTYTYTDENGCSDSIQNSIKVNSTSVLFVSRFILVNADTNEDLFELTDDMQINVNDLPAMHLDIRAETTSDVESVWLTLTGTLKSNRTENVAPYALFGNPTSGTYRGGDFEIGTYDLSATPFSLNSKNGVKGLNKVISFELLDGDPFCLDFELEAVVAKGPTQCNGNDGTISLASTGANGMVTFNWEHDENLHESILIDLNSGSYRVTAKDENGCIATMIIELSEPELPKVEFAAFDVAVRKSDNPFVLDLATPFGGEYLGEGVTEGVFDPSVGPGDYEISYIYVDEVTSCSSTVTQKLTVLDESINSVTGFTLINATTNEELFEITSGMIINVSDLPTMHLDIKANTTEDVESVLLSLTGQLSNERTENFAPYALYGDSPRSNFLGETFILGNYTIMASPFTSNGLSGKKGLSLTYDFEIIPVESLLLKPTNAMIISPNPAVDKVSLTFDLPTTTGDIQIFDVMGRLVKIFKKATYENGQAIGIQELEAGLYFIRTQDENGVQLQKQMVIKR